MNLLLFIDLLESNESGKRETPLGIVDGSIVGNLDDEYFLVLFLSFISSIPVVRSSSLTSIHSFLA